MNLRQIKNWLTTQDPDRLKQIWSQADRARRKTVGDTVHLRGLLEISNNCTRKCLYCGLRSPRSDLPRYRMNRSEIIQSALLGQKWGYRTVVIQAGEDYGIKTSWIAQIIETIKQKTSLAVTLSLGERPPKDMRIWKNAGADRYLLRFETSDTELYNKIHPQSQSRKLTRIQLLKQLRSLGYEIGSGVMIGLPGQTYQSLANDILTFEKLDLDMIGVGPFIKNPNLPISSIPTATLNQVPATELMTFKVIALSRILCPEANIPSTSALATLNIENGRETGLSRGANVVMPNLTPRHYRRLYEIYPDKACIRENPKDCRNCLHNRIQSIGRKVATGPGNRIRKQSVTVD